MQSAFKLIFENETMGKLYFDVPDEKVNLFNEAVFSEFEHVLDQLEQSSLKGLFILSKKKDIFIAGADVKAFTTINSVEKGWQAARRGQLLFHRLSQLPLITVAVIHGACMGGGTEMSLACTYRLATQHPKTRIGLPEVRLGIVPGWGGTQRLPKVVGLLHALNMILQGKSVSAAKAYKIGLVNGLLAPQNFEEQAVEWLKQILAGKKKEHKRFNWFFPEKTKLGRKIILKRARKQVLQQTHGLYPAPLKALEVLEQTDTMPIEQGLEVEARALAELIVTPQSKNLVQLFIWSEELKKEARQWIEGTPPAAPSSVVMVGINEGLLLPIVSLLRKNFLVQFTHVSQEDFETLRKKVQGHLEKLTKRKRISATQSQQWLKNMVFTNSLEKHAPITMILLAAPMPLDRLQQFMNLLPPESPLVSLNTIAWPKEARQWLEENQNMVWLNWYHWQKQATALEWSPTQNTRKQAVQQVLQWALSWGKIPVHVKDEAHLGVVNRLLVTLFDEALHLKNQFSEQQIEKALVQAGWTEGPFTLAKKIGKTALESVWLQIYNVQNVTQQNPTAWEAFWKSTEKQNTHLSEEQAEHIRNRFLLRMINAAADLLQSKMVSSARDIDFLSVTALGFPPFTGGPLKLADALGLKTVVEQLSQLAEQYGKPFEPVAQLKTLSHQKKLFYPAQD